MTVADAVMLLAVAVPVLLAVVPVRAGVIWEADDVGIKLHFSLMLAGLTVYRRRKASYRNFGNASRWWLTVRTGLEGLGRKDWQPLGEYGMAVGRFFRRHGLAVAQVTALVAFQLGLGRLTVERWRWQTKLTLTNPALAGMVCGGLWATKNSLWAAARAVCGRTSEADFGVVAQTGEHGRFSDHMELLVGWRLGWLLLAAVVLAVNLAREGAREKWHRIRCSR
ncbi:MAG: hypothetical protein N3A57_05200 [Negativicutes bacterium]|nr:hypothetical protein [Negativicutes bacterium]